MVTAAAPLITSATAAARPLRTTLCDALVSTSQAMNEAEEAELARKHEAWLQEGRESLQRDIKRLSRSGWFFINTGRLMLLTLERPLFELLLKTVNNLPHDGETHDRQISLNLHPHPSTRDCRNPPTDEALLATATELAHMVNSSDSSKCLCLQKAPTDMTTSVLTAFSRLEELTIKSCPLVTANVRSMFSIASLRKISIWNPVFPNPESIDAFCLGLETTKSLEILKMDFVDFGPEHDEQVAQHWLVATPWWILTIMEVANHSMTIFAWHYRIISIPSSSG